MNISDDFSTYYQDDIEGTYDCIDRIVVNAYFIQGHIPGGFRNFWRDLEGNDTNLNKTSLTRLASRFARRVKAHAKNHNIPIQYCEPSERKHEIAEASIPRDPDFEGVFLILVSRASAAVWDVHTFDSGAIDLRKKIRFVNHYWFHIMDRQWGHITIKMSSHPPFQAQIMFNGHEWTERKASKAGIDFIKQSNSFTWADSYTALDNVAETCHAQHARGRLSKVIDRWIYTACLCFGLSTQEQQSTGFKYNYSTFQLEYSRNLIFKRGRTLDQVFQGMIDRTRSSLDIKRIRTIFGWKRRSYKFGRAQGGCELIVEKPSYNMTVFKIHCGKITAKMYDRGDRLLRIEIVVHDSRDLKCGKNIEKTFSMISKMQEILVRFLNSLHCVDRPFLDDEAFSHLHAPVIRADGARTAGIDIRNERIRHVCQAVASMMPMQQQFQVSDLAIAVRNITGQSEEEYTTRQVAYDMKKFRAKGLIKKVPRSRRYVAVPDKIRTLFGSVTLQEKVIKPVIAGCSTRKRRPKPKITNTLDSHYESLRQNMNDLFKALCLSA